MADAYTTMQAAAEELAPVNAEWKSRLEAHQALIDEQSSCRSVVVTSRFQLKRKNEVVTGLLEQREAILDELQLTRGATDSTLKELRKREEPCSKVGPLAPEPRARPRAAQSGIYTILTP